MQMSFGSIELAQRLRGCENEVSLVSLKNRASAQSAGYRMVGERNRLIALMMFKAIPLDQ